MNYDWYIIGSLIYFGLSSVAMTIKWRIDRYNDRMLK